MPTDARAYLALPLELPLHCEMLALLLKEAWLVKLFCECHAAEGMRGSKLRSQTPKGTAFDRQVEHEQERLRSILNKLMQRASQHMKKPTDRIKIERRILSQQYGLIWLGGLRAFDRLGFLSKCGKKKLTWGKTSNFFANKKGIIFVCQGAH